MLRTLKNLRHTSGAHRHELGVGGKLNRAETAGLRTTPERTAPGPQAPRHGQ